jgi:chromosomal replication initiation ATPase DnaA
MTRRRAHAEERWIAMRVLRNRGHSLPKIARVLGFKDHTTIIYGLRKVAGRPDLLERVRLLEEVTAQQG